MRINIFWKVVIIILVHEYLSCFSIYGFCIDVFIKKT